MGRPVTAVVDYGVGNLKSVTNAMAYLGYDTVITGDAAELERADAIILPGVGAFPDAADKLGKAFFCFDTAVLLQPDTFLQTKTDLSKFKQKTLLYDEKCSFVN